ncbi:MAG: serine hydrolase [Acidobacteria bacterium]|nr:MAG: serine hydrolase [Acidobacteriota bacterium]
MRLKSMILMLGIVTFAAAQPLQDKLRARIAEFPGTVSLYAKNLDTGTAVGIRESDPVRTASTIKLPIMMAVFDAVDRRQATWTEPLTVTAAEKVGGTGIIGSEISDGVHLPLRDVIHLMIVISDNTATNMILERFPADAVNAYLDKIGIRTTRALRRMRDDESVVGLSVAGKLPQNQEYGLGVSTPRDMVTILEKLQRGEIVNADASREMIAILRRCRDDSGIRRRLRGISVANKTGSNNSFRSDVGIAYSNNGPIAMAISVGGISQVDNTPDNVGCLLIADLAKMLVDGLGAH